MFHVSDATRPEEKGNGSAESKQIMIYVRLEFMNTGANPPVRFAGYFGGGTGRFGNVPGGISVPRIKMEVKKRGR